MKQMLIGLVIALQANNLRKNFEKGESLCHERESVCTSVIKSSSLFAVPRFR